jgi:hypothetical protein
MSDDSPLAITVTQMAELASDPQALIEKIIDLGVDPDDIFYGCQAIADAIDNHRWDTGRAILIVMLAGMEYERNIRNTIDDMTTVQREG